MESKYYTPDISEFHVGFEYEHCHSSVRFMMLNLKTGEESDATESKEIWEKSIFSGNEFDIWKSSFKFDDSLRDGQIRAKYLDREDIESLGFIESKETEGYFYKELNSNSEKLVLELIQYEATGSFTPDADINSLKFFSRIKIHNTGGAPAYVLGEWITSKGVLYYGECKNKSELKRILKMIGYETRQVMDKL